MYNDDDFDEIKELIDDYEKSVANGIEPFLDVDDTIDIAQYYDDRGQTENARRVLEHGLELHPGEPEITSFLVRITLVADNDIDKAERYASMIDRNDNIDYVLAHSDILIAKGRYAQANIFIRDSIDSLHFDDEQLTDLLIEVAQMYVFADKHANALQWLRKCPIKTSIDYLELLGEVLLSLGNGEECEKVCNQLLDIDPFSPDYWNNLINSQLMQHKQDAASESIGYALAIDSNNVQARFNKARITFTGGDTKQACEQMRQIMEEQKALPAEKRDADFLCTLTLNYSNMLIDNKDFAEAIKILTELKDNAATFEQRPFSIVSNLAYAYIAAGQHDKAFATVREQLAASSGEDYCSLKVLEGTLFLDKGDYTEGTDCFIEAIDRPEATTNIVYNIGVAYFECGYYQSALEILQGNINDCGSSEGLAYVAACHKKLGHKGEFLHALKKACKQCPQEVDEVFWRDIPADVAPSNYYNYVKLKVKR